MFIFLKSFMCVLSCFSRVQLFATLWTVFCQALLSMKVFRQEYLGGLLCSPPGDLPNPGIKPMYPVAPPLQEDSLQLSHQGSPRNIYIPHHELIFVT